MKKKLLIIGFAGVRQTLTCRSLPYAGEKTDGYRYSYAPDCLAAASAVAAVGMGVEAALLARVGNDGNGEKLISVLSGMGVDTKYCVRDKKAATSLTVVIDEDEADKRMIRYRGASMNLTKDDVENAFTCYPEGVLLRLEGSREALMAAEQFAEESFNGGEDKKIPLFVSAADIESKSSVYLPHSAHTFIGDARSVLSFTGIAPANVESALRAAIELSRQIRAKYFIFRMNNGSIYLYDGTYGKILEKNLRGGSFTDIFSPAYIAEYMRCGNALAASKFALAATLMWEAAGESFDYIPTASEVRDANSN